MVTFRNRAEQELWTQVFAAWVLWRHDGQSYQGTYEYMAKHADDAVELFRLRNTEPIGEIH